MNTTWNVKISSFVKGLDGLEPEVIKSALLSIKDERYLKFRKELDEDMIKQYGKDCVVSFQVTKQKEFETNFIEGLSFDFKKDSLKLVTEYEIEVPSDWDKGDVIGWSEGFNRLIKNYFFVASEKLATGEKRDYELYNKITEFLRKIHCNEKFNVKKKV